MKNSCENLFLSFLKKLSEDSPTKFSLVSHDTFLNLVELFSPYYGQPSQFSELCLAFHLGHTSGSPCCPKFLPNTFIVFSTTLCVCVEGVFFSSLLFLASD